MRIVIVSKSLIVGAYHSKLKALAELGMEVTAVIPRRWGHQRPEVVESSFYRTVTLPCAFSGSNHLHWYLKLPDIQNADLVHIDEEPYSLVTQQLMHRCLRMRKPAIFFTWQNILKRYPPPFSLIERFSFKRCQGAIAGNEEAARVLRMKGFAKQLWVIPQYGVDIELFSKQDSSRLRNELGLDQAFIIGYMGRLIASKGVGDLVAALKELPNDCFLVLVGDGDFRAEAQRLAGELGIASRVRFVPHVSSSDVPNYLSLFDVLVLPSHSTRGWKEQFGRVLIEAMACGTPVIGSSSGEIPRVIGEAGMIFREGDLAEMTACLVALMHAPALRERFSQAGRLRVEVEYSQKHIAKQTAEVYRSVADSSRNANSVVQQL